MIGVIPNDARRSSRCFKRAQDAGIKVIDERIARAEECRLGHRADPGPGSSARPTSKRSPRRSAAKANTSSMSAASRSRCTICGPTTRSRCRRRNIRRCSRSATASASRTASRTATRPRSTRCAPIPDLKGFLIFGANGPIGAGQAVADRDKIGKVIVVGPFIPSQGQKLMKQGAITRGFLWNPIDAGYAMVAPRQAAGTGGEIKDGMDIAGHGASAGRGGHPRHPRQQDARSSIPSHDRRTGLRSSDRRRSSELRIAPAARCGADRPRAATRINSRLE